MIHESASKKFPLAVSLGPAGNSLWEQNSLGFWKSQHGSIWLTHFHNTLACLKRLLLFKRIKTDQTTYWTASRPHKWTHVSTVEKGFDIPSSSGGSPCSFHQLNHISNKLVKHLHKSISLGWWEPLSNCFNFRPYNCFLLYSINLTW